MAVGEVRSPLALLVAAVEDGTDLLGQAVAVLRARPDPAELAFHGVDDPADLPLGVADRRLLAVYEQVTGGPLDASKRLRLAAALFARDLLEPGASPDGPRPRAARQRRTR